MKVTRSLIAAPNTQITTFLTFKAPGTSTNARGKSPGLKIPSVAPKIWRALKTAPRRIPSWGLHPLADAVLVEMSALSSSTQEQDIIVFRMRRFIYKPVRSKCTAPHGSPFVGLQDVQQAARITNQIPVLQELQ
ncbi:MAG: hypothetical protein Q9174_003749 [Haloplaca sp. 1 TL-2023]